MIVSINVLKWFNACSNMLTNNARCPQEASGYWFKRSRIRYLKIFSVCLTETNHVSKVSEEMFPCITSSNIQFSHLLVSHEKGSQFKLIFYFSVLRILAELYTRNLLQNAFNTSKKHKRWCQSDLMIPEGFKLFIHLFILVYE